jgi:hypothetical protein
MRKTPRRRTTRVSKGSKPRPLTQGTDLVRKWTPHHSPEQIARYKEQQRALFD